MDEKLEYFRETIVITGKHARYVDELWSQNDIHNSYFKRLIDLYLIAPIIGMRAKRLSERDTSGDNKRTIQIEQINTVREELNTIMTMVLLLDDSKGWDNEKHINRAFRGPKNREDFIENVQLFESYVRGGIEVLHDELVVRSLSINDKYTNLKTGNIMALLEKSVNSIDLQ